MKIIVEKKKKIVIVKNNIAIRIAGKVSRYIDASMNRATPTKYTKGALSFNFKTVLPGDSLRFEYVPLL